ncbi:MAG: entericidin A/B family lipoprotein [Marinibacterium sp.]|nr:entericidin A/B family lipoprotein [Marinibacterium sp.]
MIRKTIVAPILLTTCLFALAACETVKGAGADIENAGEALSTTASNVQESL